eukprot:1451518-Rhodomonas_salina.1
MRAANANGRAEHVGGHVRGAGRGQWARRSRTAPTAAAWPARYLPTPPIRYLPTPPIRYLPTPPIRYLLDDAAFCPDRLCQRSMWKGGQVGAAGSGSGGAELNLKRRGCAGRSDSTPCGP